MNDTQDTQELINQLKADIERSLESMRQIDRQQVFLFRLLAVLFFSLAVINLFF